MTDSLGRVPHSEKESVRLVHGEPCLRFVLLVLASSSQIVLQIRFLCSSGSNLVWYSTSESFDKALFSLGGFICPQFKENRTSQCSTNIVSLTPVNFLDLGSTFSCASTSPQVSLRWMECVMNLTQQFLCKSDKSLTGLRLPLFCANSSEANIPIFCSTQYSLLLMVGASA